MCSHQVWNIGVHSLGRGSKLDHHQEIRTVKQNDRAKEVKMKNVFIIVWVIVELSIAVLVVSPWFYHFSLTAKISLTASFTMMGSMLSFICYMTYKNIISNEK